MFSKFTKFRCIIIFDCNVWGVDYDSSLSDSSKLRSSFGLGVEWFTPVGL